MSESQKKLWDNEEKRKRQSEIQKEVQNRPEVKKKVSEKSKNMWQDQSIREQILESRKKANERPEVKEKRSKVTRGGKNPRAKAVICISSVENNYDQKIFTFMREAAEWTGEKCNCNKKSYDKISECCNGTRQFWGKMPDGTLLKWRYLKDLNEEELKELLNKDLTDEEKEMVQKQLK